MNNYILDLVEFFKGCKVIKFKWIMKKKLKVDGTVDK